jgi:hypothetical protein
MKKSLKETTASFLKSLFLQLACASFITIMVCILFAEPRIIKAIMLTLVSGAAFFLIVQTTTWDKLLGKESGILFIIIVLFLIIIGLGLVSTAITGENISSQGHSRYYNIGLMSGTFFVLFLNLFRGILKHLKKESDSQRFIRIHQIQE